MIYSILIEPMYFQNEESRFMTHWRRSAQNAPVLAAFGISMQLKSIFATNVTTREKLQHLAYDISYARCCSFYDIGWFEFPKHVSRCPSNAQNIFRNHNEPLNQLPASTNIEDLYLLKILKIDKISTRTPVMLTIFPRLLFLQRVNRLERVKSHCFGLCMGSGKCREVICAHR